MEHKQLRKILSERTSRPESEVDALIEGLSVVLRQSGSELDTVAVPTFGSFVPVRHKEEIVNDLSTGKRMLLPPEITVDFVAAPTLIARLNPGDAVI